jgi:hypothetical protein
MKKVKLPAFLEPYRNLKQIEHWAANMANWVTVHAIIRHFKATEKDLLEIRAMMVAEYNRELGPRMDIVVRLHGRYVRMRGELERVQLNAG